MVKVLVTALFVTSFSASVFASEVTESSEIKKTEQLEVVKSDIIIEEVQ